MNLIFFVTACRNNRKNFRKTILHIKKFQRVRVFLKTVTKCRECTLIYRIKQLCDRNLTLVVTKPNKGNNIESN